MLGRRMGRRSLLGVAATTAVVAGTATAVSGGMQAKRAAGSQQAAEAQAYEAEQQQAQMEAAAAQAVAAATPAPAPAAAAPAGGDIMGQIQQLATLHSQGILSDEEFSAAKAKVLA